MANSYVLPQVQVFQDFNLIPQATLPQLSAHITGGNAWLVRYGQSAEKEIGDLGYYDPTQQNFYLWPQRPAGAVVDDSYTKLYMDNALLQYFSATIGTGTPITTVPGTTNEIRAETYTFAANGTDWPRSADLHDRDVQLGDVVKIRAVVGSSVYELWSYVSGFLGDTIDAEIAACSHDADNAGTRTKPADIVEEIDNLENCVTITATDSSLYDGSADGNLMETYTIEVIDASGGRQLQTATLRVTSASGNDNASLVTPAGLNTPTAIGMRGLTVTFGFRGGDCSLSADKENIATHDLVVGQKWEVTCGQAWTAAVGHSNQGNDYVGEVDCTYIVSVTRGGLWADIPEISVTTNVGSDMSGAINVTGAHVEVPCGANGVTIYFVGNGLTKGDIYYITANAAMQGAMRTLQIGNNLPQDVIAASNSSGPVAIDLTLFIHKASIQIAQNRQGYAPMVNWQQNETQFGVESGILAYDTSWTRDGIPQPLPVLAEPSMEYGKLYVEYRAWRSDLCNNVGSIYDPGMLDDYIPGALDPDNPLKWAVFKALSNNNGVPVLYTATGDPSQTSNWLSVLELLDGYQGTAYGLVPLTHDKTIQDAWQGFVDDQSSATMNRWSVAWFSLHAIPEQAIVHAATATDEQPVLAITEDDPLSEGTQYTYLMVPANNGQFITNKVRSGDIVRYLYSTDGFGNTVYTEFVVDTVVNQDTLRLLTGTDRAYSQPRMIEIWRNLNADEHAAAIGCQAGAWSNRRVRCVWPDEVGDGGQVFDGVHLCAALAALSGGVVSHQALTRVAVEGFDDMSHTTSWFNRTQLDVMAGDGVWIVTQDPNGKIYTRHGVTTGPTHDINQREEMLTRNVDAISYYFLDMLDPYIGISNVTPSLIALLRAEVKAIIMYLKSNNYVQRLGSQLIDATIVNLAPDLVLLDRVNITLNLTVPYALNNIELHLVI